MQKLNIGVILGSTRSGRVSPQVGYWIKKVADRRGDANYEIVDITDFKLPLYGEGSGKEPGLRAWSAKIANLDGFVFIVPEYNHSIPAVLKNALDSAYEEWNNKAAGIVSYGSTGGARAAEHLRGILGELKVASVRDHPTLSIFTDFENYTTFHPAKFHLDRVQSMLKQTVAWSGALKTLRQTALTDDDI
ncbi:NAD(P)H-dependent FMN reductase [Melghirimyces thermohalophilus]|uniref:NAD(P)H-dependent FMN reductase n=1 Tax=Melghirimyces thermohalophilus TaxID=1236220 RepID=A0A1G6KPI7_9BACL|nr:NADPH-dependent FMN reductase [Melghirimyces thermohalophilus]SDC32807.1 NAD(P)H-dependent FMN reductase [Melghirimyces thermohalophilus]